LPFDSALPPLTLFHRKSFSVSGLNTLSSTKKPHSRRRKCKGNGLNTLFNEKSALLKEEVQRKRTEEANAQNQARLTQAYMRTGTNLVKRRRRFADQGLDGLWEVAPGRGRKPVYAMDKIADIVEATLQTKPAGMTHWSCRTMAQNQGVSKSTVNNIWRAHNLQPHRTETFKLSRDPKFLEKMTDVVGLYLNPPQQAIVLCVDEKSQIQALDRTQPGLPIKKGRCGTMTHDYKRNGTTTLFAALEILQGKVIGECHERHRHREFIKFLRRLDAEFPGDIPLHLIMDNYGTHKHAKYRRG
jgi:hypothetical protein